MRFKQIKPAHLHTATYSRYRQYSPTSLSRAISTVLDDKAAVATTARKFNVPATTLRDRINGKISIDCVTTGREPVLSLEEEAKVVSHLKSVANFGYGYTRQEVVDIATDYAISLGKRSSDKPFTLNWFKTFIKRWPEIRVLKPRSLEVQRAKGAYEDIVKDYFERLEETITKYGLKNKPHLIFNVDEKGVSLNHSPPYVVGTKDFHPQCVTSGKSKITTILGCGSASGVALPPYFVFAGKRLLPDLMKDSTAGAAAEMSENGWSNSEIFRNFLMNHFLKFVPNREPNEHILLLLDGHKTHVSLDLVEWAKSKNIILFILPAHTSHILQPLDVACYGPLQKMYDFECHKLLRAKSAASISRYDVASLACRACSKALSPENLRSAFSSTGIYPLNKSVVDIRNLLPSEVFAQQKIQENMDTVQDAELPSPSSFMNNKLEKLIRSKSSAKKEHKSISNIISGKPVTESPIKMQLVNYLQETTPQNSKRKGKTAMKVRSNKKVKSYQQPSAPSSKKSEVNHSPKPSTSKASLVINYSSSSDDDDVNDDEKCCMCNEFTPMEVRQSISLIFVKWAQCDNCSHWVHLKYCTDQAVVRRGDIFLCPHCV